VVGWKNEWAINIALLATFRKKTAATLTELSVNRNDNLNSVICLLVVHTELLCVLP